MKAKLLAALLVAAAVFSTACGSSEVKKTDKTDENVIVELPEKEAEDLCFKSENYSVDLDMMTYFYFTDVYNMNQSYGAYFTYLSPDKTAPDFSRPLSEQSYDSESGTSWHDYFLDPTLRKVDLILGYAEEAFANGFESDADKLADKYIENLKGFAKTEGLSYEEYLEKYFGESVDAEVVKKALVLQYIAAEYQGHILDQLKASVTKEQLEEYKAGLEEVDERPTKDVRHILFTANTHGTSEAAKAKADEVHALYLNGEKTEEAFDELATVYNEDGNSLYEGVTRGQMVEGFDNWLFDESRMPGDTAVVETEYGFHLMYYVGEGDPVWMSGAIDAIVEEIYQADVEEIIKSHSDVLTKFDENIARIPDIFPETAF